MLLMRLLMHENRTVLYNENGLIMKKKNIQACLFYSLLACRLRTESEWCKVSLPRPLSRGLSALRPSDSALRYSCIM